MLVSALATLSPTPDTVVINGYYSDGDGGGGTFFYRSTPLPPDDGIVFQSTSYGGSWIRLYSGPINVRWFGAKGDGTTDDTAAVHLARDAARDGTIYFPTGTYIGAYEFLATNGEINIIGEGQGTVLKSNGTSSGGYPNPVLRLGRRGPTSWRKAKISNLTINGEYYNASIHLHMPRFSDGIIYDDITIKELSGNWDFEKITFTNCNKGVFKPNGNIGNSYINCLWYDNNFAFYAQGYNSGTMHVGCEHFIGGEMHSNDIVAIYFQDQTDGTGQIILDGIIIEGNAGFGLFVQFSSLARMTVAAICLRNVWFEENGGYNSGGEWIDNQIDIDGTIYNGKDMYFEGVRSVRIEDGIVNRVTSVESSINLYNCRSDSATLGYSVEVDSLSSIVASELRYNFQPSDKIFVNSISYDGTGDIAHAPEVATSVWGPLRCVNQYGTYDLKISKRFYDELPIHFSNSISYGYQKDGILMDKCLVLDIPANTQVQDISDVWTLDRSPDFRQDGYYVWSIHSFACDIEELPNTVTGLIQTDDGIALGQIFFKSNQWVCSYGVKQVINTVEPKPVYIFFFGGLNGGRIKICDYQVVKFTNYYEAVSFLNSRAFADRTPLCSGAIKPPAEN